LLDPPIQSKAVLIANVRAAYGGKQVAPTTITCVLGCA